MRLISGLWGTVMLCAVVAGGVLAAQQAAKPAGCPPGQTEVRPGRCQAPEFPAPSIIDYRPKSTLVTDAHLVPKAKFPVIDIHAHVSGPGLLASAQSLASLAATLDTLNVRVVVSADNLSGERLPARARRHQEQSPEGPRPCSGRHQPQRRRPRMGREGRGATRGGPQGRCRRSRGDSKGIRPAHPQARWQPASGGRPRLDPAVGRLRAAEHPGLHPHGRTAGVLSAARHDTTSAGWNWRCSRTGATTSRATSRSTN